MQIAYQKERIRINKNARGAEIYQFCNNPDIRKQRNTNRPILPFEDKYETTDYQRNGNLWQIESPKAQWIFP